MHVRYAAKRDITTENAPKPPSAETAKGVILPIKKCVLTWEREFKQIVKVKTEQNISSPDARRLCERKNTAGPVTYAQAAETVFGKQVYSQNTRLSNSDRSHFASFFEHVQKTTDNRNVNKHKLKVKITPEIKAQATN